MSEDFNFAQMPEWDDDEKSWVISWHSRNNYTLYRGYADLCRAESGDSPEHFLWTAFPCTRLLEKVPPERPSRVTKEMPIYYVRRKNTYPERLVVLDHVS